MFEDGVVTNQHSGAEELRRLLPSSAKHPSSKCVAYQESTETRKKGDMHWQGRLNPTSELDSHNVDATGFKSASLA